jgi:D-alanyl-D-alanine carboxypeptidase-like protein
MERLVGHHEQLAAAARTVINQTILGAAGIERRLTRSARKAHRVQRVLFVRNRRLGGRYQRQARINQPSVLALSVVLVCTNSSKADESYGAPPPNMATHLDQLVRSYPDWIAGYGEKDLILKRGGQRFAISDGRTNKSFEEMLEKPDIDDTFFAPYPAGSTPRQPARNSDPGRVRFEPLFVSMYGDCKENQVVKNLRTIPWLPKHDGGRVTITSVNGIDKALDAVSRELEELPPPFVKYLKPTAGTYNCREVAGSQIRSMHAYGAALDINTAFANYWRWDSKSGSEPIWKNRIPIEIVRVFERHGFIWGGYWYHYDTMHFEYRPELLSEVSDK